jgi:serine/threonine-protein kinase
MDLPIGKYEILEQLGAGGMAVAYKARDTLLGRIVALKVIKHKPDTADTAYKRFLHEARIAAGLTHPNIVTIHELGLHEGQPFIVMEYLPGQDLWDLVQHKQPLGLSRTIHIALQTASALRHAHAQGVIHRDVKPHNIRILPDDAVKLIDFGIAKLSSGEATQLTQEGTVIGTIAYMSPEQVRGQPLTPASDIFSFGIVLYELVTNTKPFAGSTTGALIYSILAADPPSIPNAAAPRPLRLLIERCLKKSPAERFPSFDPIVEALSRLQQQHPRQEPPLGRRGRAPVPVQMGPEPGRSPTAAHRRQTGDAARPQSNAAARAGTGSRTQRRKATPDPALAPAPQALLAAQRRKSSKRRKPKLSRRWLLLASILATSVLTAAASAWIAAAGRVVPAPFLAPSNTPTAPPTQAPWPTFTPSSTPTAQPSATRTPWPTFTPSSTPTAQPSATRTPWPTFTPVPTNTPKPRKTPTPRSASASSSPIRSEQPIDKGRQPARTPTADPTSTPRLLPSSTPTARPTTAPVPPERAEAVAIPRPDGLRMKRIKQGPNRGPLRIEVEVHDSSITTVTLYYKHPAESEYRAVLMERSKNNTYKAVLRDTEAQRELDYYVEGAAGSGAVSSAGDRNRPLRFKAPSRSTSEEVDVPISY